MDKSECYTLGHGQALEKSSAKRGQQGEREREREIDRVQYKYMK
jgi:hypothetical protein